MNGTVKNGKAAKLSVFVGVGIMLTCMTLMLFVGGRENTPIFGTIGVIAGAYTFKALNQHEIHKAQKIVKHAGEIGK